MPFFTLFGGRAPLLKQTGKKSGAFILTSLLDPP